MPIVYLERMTRERARAEPEAFFVFGDNMVRSGRGGQAKELRGERNAVGVVTKRFPRRDSYSYLSDADEDAVAVIKRDLKQIARLLDIGRTVYVPADGLGTGLAELPQRAPRIYAMIRRFFADRSTGCPWPPAVRA